jgi:hypothetical protein
MSTIGKSKTTMSNGQLPEQEELLIPKKYFTKEDKKYQEEHLKYEKLKHNLKKKITENIIDKIALIVQENEDKKDNHVLCLLKKKSDANGLYKIIKRIDKINKLRVYLMRWLRKTPVLNEKRKRNLISKNDRNIKITNNFYHYENKSNLAKITTDMTTKKKKREIAQKNKNLLESPKYKYNYSSNNSNISYNRYEYGGTDPNKGNIYIGKRNGDASYFKQKNHNNFGSLTIIQHNISNTKKNANNIYNRNTGSYWRNLNDMTRPSNRSQERRHELTVGSRTLRNSNSSSLVFLNSHGGKTQRNEDDNGESKILKREVPIDRKEKKVWTVRKETYECTEVF